jgi:hypothetical protein
MDTTKIAYTRNQEVRPENIKMCVPLFYKRTHLFLPHHFRASLMASIFSGLREASSCPFRFVDRVQAGGWTSKASIPTPEVWPRHIHPSEGAIGSHFAVFSNVFLNFSR